MRLIVTIFLIILSMNAQAESFNLETYGAPTLYYSKQATRERQEQDALKQSNDIARQQLEVEREQLQNQEEQLQIQKELLESQ